MEKEIISAINQCTIIRQDVHDWIEQNAHEIDPNIERLSFKIASLHGYYALRRIWFTSKFKKDIIWGELMLNRLRMTLPLSNLKEIFDHPNTRTTLLFRHETQGQSLLLSEFKNDNSLHYEPASMFKFITCYTQMTIPFKFTPSGLVWRTCGKLNKEFDLFNESPRMYRRTQIIGYGYGPRDATSVYVLVLMIENKFFKIS